MQVSLRELDNEKVTEVQTNQLVKLKKEIIQMRKENRKLTFSQVFDVKVFLKYLIVSVC